jgi:isocitrate lyase
MERVDLLAERVDHVVGVIAAVLAGFGGADEVRQLERSHLGWLGSHLESGIRLVRGERE